MEKAGNGRDGNTLQDAPQQTHRAKWESLPERDCRRALGECEGLKSSQQHFPSWNYCFHSSVSSHRGMGALTLHQDYKSNDKKGGETGCLRARHYTHSLGKDSKGS